MKRTVTFTKEQIAAYAEASGDRNPIHLDDDFARSVGLPGVIAHGMLQMGIAGTVAVTTEDTGQVITFADLATRGNEAATGGSVTAFVVKAVNTGTLQIGASAATATAFDTGRH